MQMQKRVRHTICHRNKLHALVRTIIIITVARRSSAKKIKAARLEECHLSYSRFFFSLLSSHGEFNDPGVKEKKKKYGYGPLLPPPSLSLFLLLLPSQEESLSEFLEPDGYQKGTWKPPPGIKRGPHGPTRRKGRFWKAG